MEGPHIQARPREIVGFHFGPANASITHTFLRLAAAEAADVVFVKQIIDAVTRDVYADAAVQPELCAFHIMYEGPAGPVVRIPAACRSARYAALAADQAALSAAVPAVIATEVARQLTIVVAADGSVAARLDD